MFTRWTQENLFKYLIENFDKMKEYGTEPVNPKLSIPNPAYNVLTGNYLKYSKLLMQKNRLPTPECLFSFSTHFSFLTSCLSPNEVEKTKIRFLYI